MNCKECGKDETEVTFPSGAITCSTCYGKHRKQRCVILGICISCSKSPLVNKRFVLNVQISKQSIVKGIIRKDVKKEYAVIAVE